MIPIYTIGYGARSLTEFIEVVQRYGIQFVVDVRSHPYSRYKPEFSKQALTDRLKEQGIRYLFMGDALGGQPEGNEFYVNGKVDYEKCRHSPQFQQGVARLQKAWQQQNSVVILCSEGKPEECHRTKLITPALLQLGVSVAHIAENNQLLTQEEVLLRLNEGQSVLWEEGAMPSKSRKRYKRK